MVGILKPAAIAQSCWLNEAGMMIDTPGELESKEEAWSKK